MDLATGKAAEIPKIRRFAFSGGSAGWLALHRYAPESQLPERIGRKGPT